MASVDWIKFPEVNRQLAVYSNTTSLNSYLGCHSGTISGVSITFGTGVYSNVGAGVSIKILDTTKEKPLVYRSDRYGYQMLADESEVTRAFELIETVSKEDILKSSFKKIVDQCKGTPIWVMSDVINGEAPSRKPASTRSLSYPGHRIEIVGNTGVFAKYLIDNKIGYILASPIVQNPNHRMKTNYSLNQVWVWIHPDHLNRCVNVAEQFGADKFPTKDQWVETIGKDLGIKEPAAVFKAAFNTGVFPDDKRFKRTRGRNKSVVEAIQKALDKDNPPPTKLSDLIMIKEA